MQNNLSLTPENPAIRLPSGSAEPGHRLQGEASFGCGQAALGANAELFKQDLTRAIQDAIARAHRVGTVSMSPDCLWQCLCIKSQHGPTGTNAPWAARQTFNEIINAKPFNRFVSL